MSEMIPARARLRPSNQADDAFEQLERMIVTLELAPGSEITERVLIERTMMGRTPVREAIQRLSQMGLIEVKPRKGLKIAAITPGDIVDIMRIRSHLEPIFARKSVENASESAFVELELCRSAMQQSLRRNDVALFLAADKMLDRILAESANDVYLVNALAPLQAHSRRFWYRYLAPLGFGEPARLHIDVMQACLARNTPKAEAAMRALVDYLLAAFKNAL